MSVFTVTLSGGGPWGLRLIGGHNDPLLIARLRKRSKAEDAGLQENDELVSINGQPCSTMTHGTAMSVLENSSHLTLEVARAGGGHAAASAVPSLGPAAPSSAGFDPGSRQSTSSVTLKLQAPPTGGLVNGDSNIQRYQTNDGAMHTVKDTSSTEQFGSTTLTKVQREVTTDWAPRIDTGGPQGLFSPVPSPRGASPYQAPSPRELFSPGGAPPPAPYQPPPPQFQQNLSPAAPGPAPYQVPSPRQLYSPNVGQDTSPQPGAFKNPTAKGRQNVWQPGGGSAAPELGNEPGVPPPQNALPQIGPKFNVRSMSAVTNQEAYGTWAPGGKSGPPKVSPRPMTPLGDEPASSGPAIWQPPKATFGDIVDTGPRPQVSKAPPPPPANTYTNGAPNMYGDSMPDSPLYEADFHYPHNPDTLPNVDVNRLIREGSSDGSGILTPSRKKKVFADSAFYDDPQHKYPTIEEQIKMARKVALSLTSPANKRARGHQMFNRRREKSDTWTAGTGFDPEAEIYYNPEPWKNRQGPHTWQPRSPPPAAYAPTPQPLTDYDRYMAPSYKDYGAKEEKAGPALSAEEFERMRLYEQKTLHNTVSPQVCFNLASDLRNAKGRAGQMFAKRRAKADEHVIDETNVKGGPDPNIMAKLLEAKGHVAPPPRKDVPDNKAEAKFAKAEMTPWDAALNTGGLESAFSHINKPWAAGTAPPIHGTPVPDKFDTSAAQKLEQGGGITPLNCLNFNRRARGWGSMGGGPAAAPPPPQQPQAGQWPSAPPPQAPPAHWPANSGASSPAPPQWQSGAGAAAPPQQYGAPAQPAGFSDL